MYNKKLTNVLSDLKADVKNGLSTKEADERISTYGRNELTAKKKKPLIIRFLEQFKNIMIIILLIAAVVSIIVDPKEWFESVIILVVVMINAILGVSQESKAEKSLEALKKMSSPLAKVIRNGETFQIQSSLLVPGDIIIVEAGDFVPADCRIIESSKLKIDESALTGESVPVDKSNSDIEKDNIPLGDQVNMMFSSTFVTYGHGKGVVVSTGMNTTVGGIAKMLNEVNIELTPLQVKLNQIGKFIGFVAIIVCVVVFLLEWLADNESALAAFKTSIALAVAAIPEGLSTVVTVVLAIGVTVMAKEKAIVKKLPAVETLGCTSIVCSDKTGTLTQNRMTVVKVFTEEEKDIDKYLTDTEREMLTYFAVCSDAKVTIIDGEEKRIGDPTETALIDANAKYGKRHESEYSRKADISFDSDRKMMTVFVEYNGKIISITKGAPDIIVNNSINIDKTKVLNANKDMAINALRVLGIGIREWDSVPSEENLTSEYVEKDLKFIGLIGMIDPARTEVFDAIALAKKAGIRTIMITGDHVITAKAIAEKLGIISEGQEAIASEDLHKLTDEELFNNIEKYSVYARVAPEDKVRIVNTWQQKGMVVAMTGDGVNDSPALKSADIGCAMGITGTDVAKEAAAMILVDDNFATIISAVKQGRGIYSNIKKTVKYLLSSNIGEVVTIFTASMISAFSMLNFGIPLLPMHLLWVNLITDSLPAFSLGMEKVEDDVMNDKPRDKNEGFFSHGLGLSIAWQGLCIGIITLCAYIIGHSINENGYLAQTMAFLTLSTVQLFHSFNVKSEHSIFNKKTFNNKYLIGSLIIGITLQLLIIYIVPIAEVFKLDYTMSFPNLMICFGLASIMFVLSEIEKLIKRNKR